MSSGPESSHESSGPAAACPACGVGLTREARFCPNCGLRLDEARGTRHVYGVVSPGAALLLAGILLLAGVLALILGRMVTAIALLVLSAATFVLFVGAVRRDDESPVARGALNGVRRTRATM